MASSTLARQHEFVLQTMLCYKGHKGHAQCECFEGQIDLLH